MKVFITLISLFLYTGSFAQDADVIPLKKAVGDLDLALMQRDSVQLNRLLDERLTYGHSNGWIETKREVIDDLFNGKLIYRKIHSTVPEVVLEHDLASVRAVADVDVSLNGKPMSFKLSVLQVWIKKDQEWVLLSRQSGKMN